MQGFTAVFTVLRLLTPLEPYTKTVEELLQMLRQTVQLVREAVGAGRRTYVLVNNRAEGNELMGMLR